MVSKRVRNFVIAILLLLAAQTFATDLKITDYTNTVIVVRDAIVDYGTFGSDKESDGIRINQGDAIVTAKWASIANLTVTGKDESVTPARFKVEIVMKNGQKVSATLVSKGRMKLSGKTDLGDYFIDLAKIHAIAPVGS